MNRGDPPDSGPGGPHLRREVLDEFFLGRVSAVELLGRTAEHLSAACPGCRHRLGRDPDRYRRHLEGAAAQVRIRAEELADERAELPALVARLGGWSDLDRYVAVALGPQFHTPAFVEHQVDVGWGAVAYGEPAAAREALELAAAAVQALRVDRYGRRTRLLHEGEVDLLRARILLGEGEIEAAEGALDAAGRIEAEVGCFDLHAGVLLGRGCVHLARGATESAEAALRSAAATGAGAWRGSIAEALARWSHRPPGRPGTVAPPVASREGLWREWRRHGPGGLRFRLSLTVAELARRLTLDAPPAERSAALRELAAMCQELVLGAGPEARTELPGPVVAEVARFTRRLLSGRVDAEEIRAFESTVLRLHPPWGPPTMRHDPTGGRFPTEELTDLLAESSDELQSILIAHGLTDREVEEILQDATLALLERWHGLADRRDWLLERVRRLCRQTVALKGGDEVN